MYRGCQGDSFLLPVNFLRYVPVAAFVLIASAASVTAQDTSIVSRAGSGSDTAAGSIQIVYRPPARPNPHLLPVTEELRRNAFADERARVILAGARRARYEQDISLNNYEARGYQRMSVGLSVGEGGRERLAFRREGAIRVRWFRDGAAFVDVEGARAVVPIMDDDYITNGANSLARRNMVSGAIQIPYYPGHEELWFGEGIPDASQLRFVHPFIEGAESRYQYRRGDSSSITFPDGSVIRLVELLVTPRTPEWFLVAGSFWFDQGNFRLVRATYRPTVPLEYWDVVADQNDPRVPGILRPFLVPLRGNIRSIHVEYALFHGRYWLPRVQTMEAEGQAAFMRLPLTFEQRYDYPIVNGEMQMPVIAAVDSALRATRPGACDSANNRVQSRRRFGGAVRVVTSVTCDQQQLRNSPSLPASIFDEDDADAENSRRTGVERLMRLGLRAEFAPRLPALHFGFGDGLLRYNRVEGFAPALGVSQQLGSGMAAEAVARYGTADRKFSGEIALKAQRSASVISAVAYDRLVAANDWGNPLNVGASLQAFLFGRDEGFYYRSRGAELIIESAAGNPSLDWRLYHERQHGAIANAEYSLARSLGSERVFRKNIVADEGVFTGASARVVHSLGDDPKRFRLLTDVRAEHGIGNRSFSRGLAEVTATHALNGIGSAALTLSAGSSTGKLPRQRMFMLGGTHSLRGQPPAVMTGDAFWMARVEVGSNALTVKPVLFADAGWAGSREGWSSQGRAASGAGFGLSFFDGVVRMDLARGLYPATGWRFGAYLDGKM